MRNPEFTVKGAKINGERFEWHFGDILNAADMYMATSKLPEIQTVVFLDVEGKTIYSYVNHKTNPDRLICSA